MIAGFDFLWLCTALGIGTACVISYLLGRYHGMASAYESQRPLLLRDDEAPGDSWPHCSDLVVHGGKANGAQA